MEIYLRYILGVRQSLIVPIFKIHVFGLLTFFVTFSFIGLDCLDRIIGSAS